MQPQSTEPGTGPVSPTVTSGSYAGPLSLEDVYEVLTRRLPAIDTTTAAGWGWAEGLKDARAIVCAAITGGLHLVDLQTFTCTACGIHLPVKRTMP